jgi:hypothetical protein
VHFGFHSTLLCVEIQKRLNIDAGRESELNREVKRGGAGCATLNPRREEVGRAEERGRMVRWEPGKAGKEGARSGGWGKFNFLINGGLYCDTVKLTGVCSSYLEVNLVLSHFDYEAGRSSLRVFARYKNILW